MPLLYHLSVLGVPTDKDTVIYPRIPQDLMSGEDCTVPRICVGKSLDDCLTGIGITHVVVRLLLAQIRNASTPKISVNKLMLPFVVRTYKISPSDLAFMPTENIIRYVPDAVITGECWLTEYREPYKTELLWLVDAQIAVRPFLHEDVLYDYPVILDSKWSSMPCIPKSTFLKQILNLTKIHLKGEHL